MRFSRIQRTHDALFKKLKQDYESNKFRFVVTELELAATFAEAAAACDSEEKTNRNVENARRAFEAAIGFLKNSSFTPEMNNTVAEKVERLRGLLDRHRTGRYVVACGSVL